MNYQVFLDIVKSQMILGRVDKGMKKIIIFGIVLFIIMGICIIYLIYNNKESNRYLEIKDNVRKAVLWNIDAQYPYCTVSNNYNKDFKTKDTSYNSSFLINNGYIKKSELLDIDNKSYCDVYVKIKAKYDNQYDYQEGCTIFYKIYLKCNNYEDKGYIDWEN